MFGFQQSSIWGWGNPAIWACIAAGVVLLIAFYFVELRTPVPLMEVRIFRIRAFRVENLVLGIAMLTFVPVFFFASEYAQIALGESAHRPGLYMLVLLLRIRRGLADRRAHARPDRAPSAPWCSAVPSPRWASTCGPVGSPSCT